MRKIEIRLFCSECGNLLETKNHDTIKNDFTVLVLPCKICATSKMTFKIYWPDEDAPLTPPPPSGKMG